MTDKELIDGLRRELADVQPPIDLIDRLRAQAAEPTSIPRRRFRVPVGFLTAAASITVAIAITAGALLFVHHRNTDRHTGPSTSQATGGERGTTLAQLTSSFAVLRRPQTPADRAIRVECVHPCAEQLVPELTRLARTLPDGSRVFLSVWRVRLAERSTPRDTLRVPAGRYVLDELVVPKGQEAILSPGSLVQFPVVFGGMESGMPSTVVRSSSAPLWTGVVPDGVSTVHWTFSCVHGRRAGACPRPASATAAANVLDNVAAAVINQTRHGTLGVISASWFDPAAHAVASFSSVDDQTTIRFVPRGIVLHSRLVLNADGLGPIRFGASLGQLERLLFPMLGQPDGGYQATLDECGADHALTWPILLNPSTGRPERGEELTVLFHRGRFVGYQYGGYALPPDAARSYVRAATAAGLVIGDTFATGQRLYGRAFRISVAQGGTWEARTPHGTLTGYGSGHPKIGDVSPSSRVASIDAGDVGCPAVSP